MNKKGPIKRILSALLCAVLLMAPLTTIGVGAEDASLEDLQSQRDTLSAQAAELEAQKNQAATTLEEKQAYKANLEQQISVKEQEIALTGQMIDQVDAQLNQKSYELAQQEIKVGQQEAALEDRFQQLRQRLRAISKTGNMSSLQMVMDTEDYTDYLIKSKIMERISESDQALMDELEAELAVLNTQKDQIQNAKNQLAEERKPLVQLQNDQARQEQELTVLKSEVNVVINELNNNIANYQSSIDQILAEQAAMQAKIDELLRVPSGNNQAFKSGDMYWPTPDLLIITSRFKYRWGSWHTGIDISGGGAMGSPIVAAASGTVISASWGYGSGYGNHVILDNGIDSSGNRIMTLYGHCSDLYVSEGQSVVAGQTIAAVGNTGNSTGAHLHFEVRVNGTAVDPLNGYVSLSNGVYIDESL